MKPVPDLMVHLVPAVDLILACGRTASRVGRSASAGRWQVDRARWNRHYAPVSIVIKFFVAPDAEAAAAVAEGGCDGVFESLTFGNFDVEEALIEWEGIFTGRSFEEVLDDDVPETVVDPDGEGPLVLAVSGTFRDALCTAVEHRLAEVSRLWVAERAADGEVFDSEIAVWILSGLADLARAVREGDENLYCWVA